MSTVQDYIERLGLQERLAKVPADVRELPVVPLRKKRRSGEYVYRDTCYEEIRIHVNLKPEDLPQTFVHEVAHAVARRLGDSSHGRTWKLLMMSYGAKPLTRSNFSYVGGPAKYVFACSDCGAQVRWYKWTPNIPRIAQGLGYHPPCRRREKHGVFVTVGTTLARD